MDTDTLKYQIAQRKNLCRNLLSRTMGNTADTERKDDQVYRVVARIMARVRIAESKLRQLVH